MAEVAFGVNEVLIAHRLGSSHSTAKTQQDQDDDREGAARALGPSLAVRAAGAAAADSAVACRGALVGGGHVRPPFLADAFDDAGAHGDEEDHDEEQHRGGRRGADPVVGERGVGDQPEDTWVEIPGPPPVIRYTWSKIFRLAMICSSTTSVVVRLSSGIVIQRICCHGGGAVDGGRLVELPRDVLQAGEVEDEVEADRPPDRGDGDADHGQRRGRQHRRRAATPSMRLERVPQPGGGRVDEVQISAIAAEGRMNGTKNASRKNHWPRGTRLARTAKTNARITSGGTV